MSQDSCSRVQRFLQNRRAKVTPSTRLPGPNAGGRLGGISLRARICFAVFMLFAILLALGTPLELLPTSSAAAAPGTPMNTVSPECKVQTSSLPGGKTTLKLANSRGGVLVAVVAASDIQSQSGSFLFESASNYTVWWSNRAGSNSYTLISGPGVASAMSCNLGLSLRLLGFVSGRTNYTVPVGSGEAIFVLALCMGSPGECTDMRVGPYNSVAPVIVGRNATGEFIDFYYALVNSTQSTNLTLGLRGGFSSVYFFSVSDYQTGRLVAALSPSTAAVYVNGTKVGSANGLLNISLPYGVYNLTFQAPGYYNLSLNESVYGGVTTRLNVQLSSIFSVKLEGLDKTLGLVIPAIPLFAAAAVGIFKYRYRWRIQNRKKEESAKKPRL